MASQVKEKKNYGILDQDILLYIFNYYISKVK